jgi:hypothetical protein
VETGTRVLSHADRIEIGNTVFRFEHPASERAALAAGGAPARPVPTATIAGSGSPVPPVAPSPGLPLPAVNTPPPASPDRLGLPLQPQHGAGPNTAGSSPAEDLHLERPQQESAPPPEAPSPWSAAPQVPPPAMAAAASPELLASPAYVPLVPRGPISGRKLLVGTIATFVGLIAIAIAGMLIGGDESIAQGMEPPMRVEELLLPLLEPLLELGAVTDSLSSDTGPTIEPDIEPDIAPDIAPEVEPDTKPDTEPDSEADTAAPDEIPAGDEPAGDQAP